MIISFELCVVILTLALYEAPEELTGRLESKGEVRFAPDIPQPMTCRFVEVEAVTVIESEIKGAVDIAYQASSKIAFEVPPYVAEVLSNHFRPELSLMLN